MNVSDVDDRFKPFLRNFHNAFGQRGPKKPLGPEPDVRSRVALSIWGVCKCSACQPVTRTYRANVLILSCPQNCEHDCGRRGMNGKLSAAFTAKAGFVPPSGKLSRHGDPRGAARRQAGGRGRKKLDVAFCSGPRLCADTRGPHKHETKRSTEPLVSLCGTMMSTPSPVR